MTLSMPTTDDAPPSLDESTFAGTVDDLPLSTRFRLGPEITALQAAFLERHGFILFSQVAKPDEVAAILADIQAITDELVESGERSIYGAPIWLGTDPDGKPLLQRMAFTTVMSVLLKGFVRDERFEPVRRVVGEDARIGDEEKDGAVFNTYVDGSLRPSLAWHTDALRGVFYHLKPAAPMFNIGLHFDRIRPEDGGLYLLPGTHEQSLWSTRFSKIHFLSQAPDANEVHVETWPGDLTIHDGRMWHRVATSEKTGWESVRRSMYVPYVRDAYDPKSEDSQPLLYHRLFNRVMKWKGAR
ncbi:MAG: phytanoyl-CoA dioxygenase family protein [Proteobacteria bacterium]|nr:phytanoyl-CoA dioxygenase family protein [Pseudomonadota bacterium]